MCCWMFLFPFPLCALVCIMVPCRHWESRAAAAKARLLWSIHVMLLPLCNSSLGWRRAHTRITQYALIHSLYLIFYAHIRHVCEIKPYMSKHSRLPRKKKTLFFFCVVNLLLQIMSLISRKSLQKRSSLDLVGQVGKLLCCIIQRSVSVI